MNGESMITGFPSDPSKVHDDGGDDQIDEDEGAKDHHEDHQEDSNNFNPSYITNNTEKRQHQHLLESI